MLDQVHAVANKSIFFSLLSNLMRQFCEDVYCARDAKCRIKFTEAIKSVLPAMKNLMRQSCEDVYCARDAKCRIEFTVAINSVLPAMQSDETVL